jgi:flagellar biosynthetic protein FliP
MNILHAPTPPAPTKYCRNFRAFFCIILQFSILFWLSSHANAATDIAINLGDDGQLTRRILQIIALTTVLSIAPSLLIMVTSFTRIIIVFSFLRNAMGLQQTPPNPVLISLSLFLTAFIMAPTFEKAYQDGIKPLMNESIKEEEAIPFIIAPFRHFMTSHVRDKDLELFMTLGKQPASVMKENAPLHILIPAFMISELRRAFEIGFLIFIPFLIIDMLISSILMAMGMMMLPPVMISMPFKLIFFVMIDGWYLLCGSLVRSF